MWRWKKHTDNTKSTAGYVYVLSLGFDGLYKIGMTRNIQGRVRELGSSNPFVKEVCITRVRHPEKIESKVHKKFKKNLVKREIYRLSDQEVRAVMNYLDRYSPAKPDVTPAELEADEIGA